MRHYVKRFKRKASQYATDVYVYLYLGGMAAHTGVGWATNDEVGRKTESRWLDTRKFETHYVSTGEGEPLTQEPCTGRGGFLLPLNQAGRMRDSSNAPVQLGIAKQIEESDPMMG